jgi:hypothetical protein
MPVILTSEAEVETWLTAPAGTLWGGQPIGDAENA